MYISRTPRQKIKRRRIMDALDSYENTLLRERVRELENALGQKSELLQNTFKLSPVLSNLLGLLLALPAVKAELVHHRVGIACAKVSIHRLRKVLEPFGVDIKSQRMVGYWLTDEDKLKVRDILVATREGAGVDLAA